MFLHQPRKIDRSRSRAVKTFQTVFESIDSSSSSKMSKERGVARLRSLRTQCPCKWCAKTLDVFGRRKKLDFKRTSSARLGSADVEPGNSSIRTPPPLAGAQNSSEPESVSKRSDVTDSDSTETRLPEGNRRIWEYIQERDEEASEGERDPQLFMALIDEASDCGRATMSSTSSGCNELRIPKNPEINDRSKDYENYSFASDSTRRRRSKLWDDDGTFGDCEDDGSDGEYSDEERGRYGDRDDSVEREHLVLSSGSASFRDFDFATDQGVPCEERNCPFGCSSNESVAGSEESDRLRDFDWQNYAEPPSVSSSPHSAKGSSLADPDDLDDMSDNEMPSEKESKMNLSALKQVDPEINEIVDSAAQVALYQYSTQTGQWAKTEVEGALYVYAHRNAHQRGLIILNRNSPKNYKEPIRADIEFKIKTPFLIYKTTAGHIFGAWFYVEEECTRVGNLCCRLVSYLKKRGKNESGSQPDNNNQQQGSSILQNLLPPSALPKVDAQSGANIMSLLKKAEGGSAQVTNGNSNGNVSNHQNGNVAQHHQNGKSKKQPLTPNNSNHNESGRQQENGHHRKAAGDSTPGVPVVHKPVPTRSLPSSVEQLFKSAANPQQQQQKKQQQQQGSSSTAKQHYSQMPESTTPRTPRGAQNGGGGGDLERLLGDLSRSSLESPPPSVALVETKIEVLNPLMASILSKLNESAQKVQREAEMPRSSPTTEEALLGAFKGPLQNITGLEKKLTLITPEMLEESLSQGPSTPPQTLSRYELKSALLHLLDTDEDFLTKIHNAYVQGVCRRKL